MNMCNLGNHLRIQYLTTEREQQPILKEEYEFHLAQRPQCRAYLDGLKALARDFDLACICINSVTKERMGDDAPSLRSLRGSGQVIHDADIIGYLTNGKSNNVVNLTFIKTRDVQGKFTVSLYAHSEYPKFDNAAVSVEKFGWLK